MSGHTLAHFLSTISSDFRDTLTEAENAYKWKALSIREEGRELETANLRKLYETLQHVHESSPFADPDMPHRLAVLTAAEVFRRTGAPADNDRLVHHVAESALSLLQQEIIFGFPAIDWNVPLSLEDSVALRAYLEQKRHFLLYSENILEIWCDRFVDLWAVLFQHLPDRIFSAEPATTGTLSFSEPLIDSIEDLPLAVENLLASLFSEDKGSLLDQNLFQTLIETIDQNICSVSGIPYEERETSRRQVITPTKCRETSELIPQLYLQDTPFLSLFFEKLPVDVPETARFEHCHIVAGTGHGKTQLMQFLIAQDLERVASGKASIVVIDSQGDLIKTISHLEGFAPGNPLSDRLVLIDPSDVTYPVALNMFDMSIEHPDPLQQEKLLNGLLELYDFIFGSLLGAELTQKQSVIFRYVARLMLKVPGATIQHLRKLMEPDGYHEFEQFISKLESPTARAFFETEFNSREFDATKKQVRRRLWGVLENSTFENMFSYPKNKLNFADEMNAGKVILISTSKDLLKQNGTEIFGRFFIALITQAALERAALPKQQRLPTYVYIDEANDYFEKGDDNLPLILETARKQNISLTLAHQYLDQLDTKLKSSLLANTSTKIVGGLSQKDTLAFAKEMYTDTNTIEAKRKYQDHSEFAAWVKNVTRSALTLHVPFGHMEALPQMSEETFASHREAQRARYAVPAQDVRQCLKGTVQNSGTGADGDIEPGDLEVSKESGWRPATTDGETPIEPT